MVTSGKFKLILAAALLSLFIISGCSMQNDTPLVRTYQNITGKFNALFNAREIMRQTEANLRAGHIDDYTQVLEVFPYGDQSAGLAVAEDMEKVIEKATKIIHKKDKSKWVDDSYFLIGKANYYKRDLPAAIELFEFVNSRYARTDIAYESQIWLAKTYILEERYNDAEAILTNLNNTRNFPEHLDNDLKLVFAELNIKNGRYATAAESLEKVIPTQKNRDHRVRNQFILAQLYQLSNKHTEANNLFTEITRSNPPYEMMFYANIFMARSYIAGNKANREVVDQLNRMLRDDKNIKYHSQIYYELGQIALKDNDHEAAIDNFTKSLLTSNEPGNLKTNTYLALAELHFNNSNYPLARAYYDSTAISISKEHPQFDKIRLRKDVLNELIDNLIIVQREDSLLKLASLSPEQLESRINQIVENERREQRRLEDQRNQNPMDDQFRPTQQVSIPSGGGSEWYFYNATAVNIGKSDFARRWGNRPLTDNWRRSSVERTVVSNDTEDLNIEEEQLDDRQLQALAQVPSDLQAYYRNIPLTEELKKASNERLMESLFKVGTLYFEPLEQYNEAVASYKDLLNRYPTTIHKPQTYYNLYRIYTAQNETTQANRYRELLAAEFPDNEFTLVLHNPELLRQRNRNHQTNPQLEAHYSAAYDAYLSGNCNEVSRRKAQASNISDNYLKANFDYLEIICKGKNQEHQVLLANLESFIVTYPGLEVTKHADDVASILRNRVNPITETSEDNNPTTPETNPIFEKYREGNTGNFFYALHFKSGTTNATQLRQTFSEFNVANFRRLNLAINALVLNQQDQVIIVQEFSDKQTALNYLNAVNANRERFSQYRMSEMQPFIISGNNFSTFMQSKNVEEYLEFYREEYGTKP